MRYTLLSLFALCLVVALAGCDDAPATTSSGTPVDGTSCCDEAGAESAAKVACTCKAGKAGAAIWCEACDKGYVDAKEVCCPSCVKKALKKAAKTDP